MKAVPLVLGASMLMVSVPSTRAIETECEFASKPATRGDSCVTESSESLGPSMPRGLPQRR
jgi:hypothetical protein